jgi:hypothetical protein
MTRTLRAEIPGATDTHCADCPFYSDRYILKGMGYKERKCAWGWKPGADGERAAECLRMEDVTDYTEVKSE